MGLANERVEIQVVVVPPRGEGVAYGHDGNGNCIAVHGERRAMLELFHRLREAGRDARPGKVYLLLDEPWIKASIERSACPTHQLPEIPDGTAIAWAPY